MLERIFKKLAGYYLVVAIWVAATAVIVIPAVYMTAMSFMSKMAEMNYPRSSYRFFWKYDFLPGSRSCVREYFTKSGILRGKTVAEVKDLLAFGRSGDNESIDSNGDVVLSTTTSSLPHLGGMTHSFSFRNGKEYAEKEITHDF